MSQSHKTMSLHYRINGVDIALSMEDSPRAANILRSARLPLDKLGELQYTTGLNIAHVVAGQLASKNPSPAPKPLPASAKKG